MASPPERYFYHSFPQPPKAPDTEWMGHPVCHKIGLSIIDSICRVGLLITPESYEFPPEEVSSGRQSEPLAIYQKRLCFTELSPTELRNHASYFGPFALEFELITLRKLGAMPVIYIANVIDSEAGYSGIGVSLVNRLSELNIFLERILKLNADAKNYPKQHYIKLNNTSIGNQGVIECTFGGLIDLISSLEQGNRDIETLQNSLRALASLMYPTDDPANDELLIYFREREWRIINEFSRNGVFLAQDLTEEDKSYLVNLTPVFSEIIKMRNGDIRYVDACYALKTHEDVFVLKLAKRLIAPKTCLDRASAILKQYKIDLEVSPLEAL